MADLSAGCIVIVSGPSGVGKSTLVRELLRRCDLRLKLSVSATTRMPRTGECNGVDYFFLSSDEFARRRQNDEFLECFEVFSSGEWYGTLKSEVEAGLSEGCAVILEIDVRGALRVLEQHPDAISIFIQPASSEVLEQRLRGRGTEPEEVIQRRLERSRRELEFAHRYKHSVINDDVARATQEICDIIRERSLIEHAG